MDEAVVGSNPIDPPTGAVAERRMHFAVDEDDDGSNPFGPANFNNGRLAETDQRRSEEPKSLVRYQERPPLSNIKRRQNYVCTK